MFLIIVCGLNNDYQLSPCVLIHPFIPLSACLSVCVCLSVCLSVCLQDTLRHSKGIGTLTKKTKAPQITEEDKFKAAIEVKKNAMKSSVADLWKRLQVNRKGRKGSKGGREGGCI